MARTPTWFFTSSVSASAATEPCVAPASRRLSWRRPAATGGLLWRGRSRWGRPALPTFGGLGWSPRVRPPPAGVIPSGFSHEGSRVHYRSPLPIVILSAAKSLLWGTSHQPHWNHDCFVARAPSPAYALPRRASSREASATRADSCQLAETDEPKIGWWSSLSHSAHSISHKRNGVPHPTRVSSGGRNGQLRLGNSSNSGPDLKSLSPTLCKTRKGWGARFLLGKGGPPAKLRVQCNRVTRRSQAGSILRRPSPGQGRVVRRFLNN